MTAEMDSAAAAGASGVPEGALNGSAASGPGGGTVGKALSVLDMVAAHGKPVRFVDLVPESPFPKATLYRFLQTLVGQGMLSYDSERQTYALGVRLVRLAHAAWRQSSLAPVARPHIASLAETMGETVHLAQLDHAQVLYVDKRSPSSPVEMYSAAGKVGPAYCTGVGKAMLAYLDPDVLTSVLQQQSYHGFTATTITSAEQLRAELEEIRATGFALDREEHEPGIICVAVPILSEGGRLMGALSLTSTTSRRDLKGLEGLAPEVRRVAARIAADAEDWRFPDRGEGAHLKGGEGHVRGNA